MALLLKGAPVAAALTENLILRAKALKAGGIEPCLALLRVGENPDDLLYERSAEKRCETVGIGVRSFLLPADASQADLMAAAAAINADASVHGCLMFRPLPHALDEKAVCEALDVRKDADGITRGSMAKVYAGSGTGFAPCTAEACLEMLRFYGIGVSGKRVAVIGRSLVIGRPVAQLLMAADGTVTVCHRKTRNLPAIIREADIVIAAVGKAEVLGADCFREGQTVLDVGVNWSEEKQKPVGDVDFAQAEPLVAAISPVPGGIGAVTTAVLCRHVLEAAEQASA